MLIKVVPKIIVIVFVLYYSPIFSQNKVTVEYIFKQSKEFPDSAYFDLIKPTNLADFTFEEKFRLLSLEFKRYDKYRKTIRNYELKDTTCAFVADGFNHEIILIPRDTVKIIVPDTITKRLNSDYLSPWMRSLSYEGKNKYITTLFDSIAYHTGAVHIDEVSFRKTGFDLNNFFELVTGRFQKRISYLEYYSNKYHIPPQIKTLVNKEIEAAYILNLLEVLQSEDKKIHLKELPSRYFQSFSMIKNNDNTAFFKTWLYKKAVYSLMLNMQANDSSLNGKFNNAYNIIKNSTSNPIKDYLLALHLSLYSQRQTQSYDSILTDFKSYCKNMNYVHSVDSIARAGDKKSNLFTLEQALNSIITSPLDKKTKLNELFNGNPLVIDCWASWCAPCNYQTPFTVSLANLYKGKVSFIYLSFDSKKADWLKKIASEKSYDNQYLLDNNFKSAFSEYFDIRSIPRYLVFDKNGKLINADAPRPSRKDAMTALINKLL